MESLDALGLPLEFGDGAGAGGDVADRRTGLES